MADITPNRGSDNQGSPPPGGGSFGNNPPRKFRPGLATSYDNDNNLDGISGPTEYAPLVRGTQVPESPDVDYDQDVDSAYEPGEPTRRFFENEDGSPAEMGTGYTTASQKPANFEDPYESQNAANFSDPEYLKGKQAPKRDLMAEARRVAGRGKASLVNNATRSMGDALVGDKHAFREDTPENRERVKQLAEEKIKKEASERIGKKIGNEAVRKTFQEGLTKGSKAVAKEGVQKAGEAIAKKGAKAATKTAAKAATETAAKVGAQAGTKAVQGAVTAAGAGTGAATFGLGFVLSLLLNIAISLSLSDAIDAAFELKAGNLSKARFLATRAAMKIEMFIILLLIVVTLFSTAGIIIAIPLLIYTNIYMLLRLAFPNTALFQGLVWWEVCLILILDGMLLILVAAFLAGLGWWICQQTGLGSGTLSTVVTSVYDWWTGAEYAGTINEMCKSINAFAK